MSSHHIIREDQEPALLIDDAQPENFESIQQLLEWSPTVMVTEHALEQVLLWGIKIDIVIADHSRIETLKLELHDQFPLRILSCSGEADAVPSALYFLTAAKQKAVNIISPVALESFENSPALDISVIQQGKRWIFIRTGHFEKWLPKGTELAVYPKNSHPVPKAEVDGIIKVSLDHSFWICEIN